jgi:general secretion pathway protein B
MSVILDALKKLEQEKVSSRTGPVDIIPEIVKTRYQRARSKTWLLVAVMFGVVAATAAVTTFVMEDFPSGDHKPVFVAYSHDASLPEAIPAPPAKESGSEMNSGEKNNQVAGTVPQNVVTPPVRTPVQTVIPSPPLPKPKIAPINNIDEPPQVTGSPFPSLKVSGIAWQEDKSDRRAVVNGVLAVEGEVIEGARIVTIYQDKVRFSCGGRTFDIAVAGPTHGK